MWFPLSTAKCAESLSHHSGEGWLPSISHIYYIYAFFKHRRKKVKFLVYCIETKNNTFSFTFPLICFTLCSYYMEKTFRVLVINFSIAFPYLHQFLIKIVSVPVREPN